MALSRMKYIKCVESLSLAWVLSLVGCAGLALAHVDATPSGGVPTSADNTEVLQKNSAAQASDPESITRQVMKSHGFPLPITLPGPDSARWMISARPGSKAEFTLAIAKLTPEGRAVMQLEPYCRVGSEWPMLGRILRQPSQREAQEMTEQIAARLAR